jgi:hypothetical protein
MPGRELECCRIAAAEGLSILEIELLDCNHDGLVTHRGIHVHLASLEDLGIRNLSEGMRRQECGS